MEKFLVQTFTISNHPIKKLKESFKLQYVRGLGEFLCYITKEDYVAKIVFEIWCSSILGRVPDGLWTYSYNFDSIKEGLAIHRDGLTFFTMRQTFLFDCFYLLEKSKKNLHRNAYMFLSDKVCGFFTKGSLNYAYGFFKGTNSGDKLPEVMRRHRHTSQIFCNKKVKRVLIVATMSAGKSTLINALVGQKINQVKATACTSNIHYIYNKPASEGAIALVGERQLIYTSDYNLLTSKAARSIGVNFTSSLSNSRVCLIDTPGVNYNGDKTHGEITRTFIEKNNYDLLVIVLNGEQLAIDDERDLIDFIGKNCKRKVIGVLNRCDSYNPTQDSIEKALDTSKCMMKEAGINNSIVIPISAQAAYLSRLASKSNNQMTSLEAFQYRLISEQMQDSFYNLPSYLPGVPQNNKIVGTLARSGIPYVEHLISVL